MSDLNFLKAVEMAEGMRAGKFSPVELVDAHLARIEQLNPKLNAFVRRRFGAGARAGASGRSGASSRGKSDRLGSLHGVPISIKSSMDVAGFPSRMRQPVAEGIYSARGCAARDEAARGGRDCVGQHERAGISDGVRNGQF